MILGREGVHKWTSADGVEIELNRLKDNVGVPVRPHVRLREAGLASLGDATDNRDVRVGEDGEIPRTSHRRGKTVSYEGVIRAGSARELRNYQAELRAAFANRSDEGAMEVFPHELNPEFDEGEGRSLFHARVVGLEMLDLRDSQRFESTFVLALRMSDARYFERLTVASLKAAIVELEPSLYWALDAADGASDLSGNGRDGTAQGGVSLGAAAGLTPVLGDSSTDFDGTNDCIASGYDPFVDGTVRTFCGVARLDSAPGSSACLFGSAGTFGGESVGARVDNAFDWGLGPQHPAAYGEADWGAINQTKPWTIIFDQAANRLDLWLAGTKQVEGFAIPIVGEEAYASGSLRLAATYASPSAAFWPGKQAHFAVFERGLSDEEVELFHVMAQLGIRTRW